jgi:small subunit ribosomal protein S4
MLASYIIYILIIPGTHSLLPDRGRERASGGTMASDRGPKGRIVRALGINIFGNPKFDRLLQRKPGLPGKDPKARAKKKTSEYGIQLKEKRKYRAAYGLGERQLRNLCDKALHDRGSTGDAILSRLESRLSNVVFRLGWAASRHQARQMVSHGHVVVNGKRLNIPSAALRAGDTLELRAPVSLAALARERIASGSAALPSWLARESDGLVGRLSAKPDPAEASVPGKVSMLVEFYAR